MIFDFSDCQLSEVYYGGSERKLGIIFNNEKYMLKFQKHSPFGVRFNHISEYLGSHIFQMLGIKAHDTFLGIYKGENVVACKDFVNNRVKFVPFNDVGESSLETDKDKYQYSYEDIVELLEKNKKITNVEETISIFFDMYIIDALIGNFDRHGGNWGFLKENNNYLLAPIFDNGSSMFPQMTNEDEMRYIISNEKEINKRVYEFPTSQIKLHGKKSSYYEVISSLEFEECNKALIRIYNRIHIENICKLIDGLEISNIHKQFYRTMIIARYEKIIKYAYERLVNKNE